MKPEILLKAYVQHQSEDAFRELVAGTLDEVYSTSIRITQGAQRLAEDATLNAYLQLARQAWGLSQEAGLVAWLRRRACKIAVSNLRAADHAIDWAIVKKEKKVRSTSSEVQPAPPGLAIYICKTVFATVKSRRGFRLRLPRISWPARIRPLYASAGAICALAIVVWWHNPFQRHNKIIWSTGPLLTPAAIAQLANPEEWKGPVANTNALGRINLK